MELEGKTAVVTGASSGFGAATVRKLREAGVRVVGGARRVERIEADVALPLDVTDEESCAAFVGRAASELGGIDILYNNAGLALGRYPFTESNAEDEATVLHTNVDGAIRITRLAPPARARRGPHPLHGLDRRTAGVPERGRRTSRRSSRCAGSCTALREDLLGRPIRITTVDPGLAETEFSLVRFRGDAEAAKAPLRGRRAAHRRRRRRLRPLRAHAAAARERRRDRHQGARAVERRPHPAPGDVARSMLTILEGSTFCISDDRGDIAADTSGFFAHDTRFLSRLVLTRRRRGAAPALLGAGRALQGRASTSGTERQRAARRTRSRSRASASSGRGCRSGSSLRNESPERLEIERRARGGLRLRGHHLGEAPRLLARRPGAGAAASRRRRRPTYDEGAQPALDRRPARRPRHAPRLLAARPARRRRDDVRARARAARALGRDVDVIALARVRPRDARGELDDERETAGDVVAAWTLRVPRVRGGWESLRRSFDRSIADLAALRMRTGEYRRPLFAAGMPWFMTVFGRDTAITSLQTLLLGPEIAMRRARRARRAAGARGRPDDRRRARQDRPRGAARAAAPRRGSRATTARSTRRRSTSSSSPRRGAGPTTPSLAQRLREPALARARVDRPLRRPRRRRLRRVQPQGRLAGSRTSRGRTRATRSASRTAASPSRRSRRSRCRATSTTRSAGSRSSRARCGATSALAERLEREADELRARFDEAFWVDGARRSTRSRSTARSGPSTRALEHGPPALERDRPARARRGGRRPAALARSSGPAGASGRWRATRRRSTRSATTTGRSGRTTRRSRRGGSRATATSPRRGAIGRALIEAAAHFDWSLPEVFAGYARDETPFPIAYPTAARPQAWAAGTPILLVRVLLGLEPDRERQRIVSTVADELPSWLDGLRIEGVRAYGRTWTVAVERGHVTIAEGVRTMRVARRSVPVWFPVPPEAMAGPSGSSRCSRTGSSTRDTT